MAILVIVRHGQSEWNLKNLFTGLADVELTRLGEQEAEHAGMILRPYHFDVAFTSVLKRAVHTLEIMQKAMRTSLPVVKNAALNERDYGDLQGLNKEETGIKYGVKQLMLWRRSYTEVPPNGESLENTYQRAIPYFQEQVEPKLKEGTNVLIVAHGNSLRALLMYLEHIDAEAITHMDIATGAPRLYEFSSSLEIIKVENVSLI